jgi:imidazolonepropionase-like amidohydrolase
MLMAGTDSPDPYVFPGFSLHDELELLVKSGLSNMQALQTATFYPALFMTRLDRYGVVETGHVADMVVLDDDPLRDISNTKKISAVILGGRYFGRSDLDKMLHDVATTASTE